MNKELKKLTVIDITSKIIAGVGMGVLCIVQQYIGERRKSIMIAKKAEESNNK